MGTIADRMRNLGACTEAVDWLRETRLEAREAWEACKRADWMLWACGHLGVDRKLLVAVACRCWRAEAQRYVPEGELRPLRAVETAEAWVRGEAMAGECRTAAAYAAAAYAYAYAYAAAYAADGSAALKRMAIIVREVIPWAVVEAALAE